MLDLHTVGTYRREAVGGGVRKAPEVGQIKKRRGKKIEGKGEKRENKENSSNWTEGGTDEREAAMLRRLYLCLLLGWRRCCCCGAGASPVATATPPAPSCWCCLALLRGAARGAARGVCWLWPSDGEGFDVPGLL